MLVISWNINAKAGAANDRLAAILKLLRQAAPDLLLLQEVGNGSLPDRLRSGLSDAGLSHSGFSGDAGSNEKRYGCIVASKWPIQLRPSGWAAGAPWPQLLAAGTVMSPASAMDVFVAHIPNGSGNGWRKIETFESLALGLGGAGGRPRILGGDFNEPLSVLPNGEVIPFGGLKKSDGSFHWEGQRFHPQSGDTHPRVRWRNGVLSILDPGAAHDLRHVWFDRHGYSAPTTHVTRGSARFFDHLLVSNHFEVLESGYHDSWRTPGISDHSAAWARIELRQHQSA